MFSLYVDSDSLPVRERKIILNRSYKEDINAYFVADRPLPDVLDMIASHKAKLRSPYKDKEERRKIDSTIKMIVVEKGQDSADNKIVDMIGESDIVISHDVGLSFRCIEKGAIALDDRGAIYTKENIRERVSERDYMKEFREMGINDLKQSRLTEKDFQKFANSFDTLISKR